MGRTHEALERAEREYQEQPGGPRQIPMNEDKHQTNPATLDQMTFFDEITTKITTLYADKKLQTIHITGASKGCGASTTALGLSVSLSRGAGYSTLLVTDAEPYRQTRTQAGIQSWLETLAQKKSPHIVPHRSTSIENLYFLPQAGNPPRATKAENILNTKEFDAMVANCRKNFDFIIFDSLPIISSNESKILAQKCDGVILVAWAGKTRQKVAQRAQRELESAGADILGVILNRRHHHIPEWLYKRL